MSGLNARRGSLTDRTVVAAQAILSGERRGPGRLSRLCRTGGRRLDRLHGSRQFRHQHPGRREIRLQPALGRAAGQHDRHAVPGAVGQARHRHRPQSRGNVPRPFFQAGGHRDVGGERDRRHGHRSRRISRRRGRPRAAVQDAADLRHGRHRRHHLRHPDGGEPRLPPGRADHRQLGRHHRALLSDRDVHRAGRLGRGGLSFGACRKSPTPRRC